MVEHIREAIEFFCFGAALWILSVVWPTWPLKFDMVAAGFGMGLMGAAAAMYISMRSNPKTPPNEIAMAIWGSVLTGAGAAGSIL